MSVPPELIHNAIQAAESGQRERALSLFLQVVEEDPYQAEAWIYLSDLVDSPDDRLIALENALALRPDDAELVRRRTVLLLAHPELSDDEPNAAAGQESIEDQVQQAQRLLEAGQREAAVRLLEQVVSQRPREERAWQMLSEIHPDITQKMRALEQLLAFNPDNQAAREMLAPLHDIQQATLTRGQHLEERGEFDQAALIYRMVIAHSRLPAERLEAQRRLENISLNREAHELQPVHPNLNLGRLAAGPVLLFLLMLLMQSGLNPLRLPLLALPGIASVVAGSLLVALTEMRPAPAVWVRFFGQPGTGDEPEMRRGLRLLGWALLLAPYSMFLIEAGHRLGVLQATMLGGLR